MIVGDVYKTIGGNDVCILENADRIANVSGLFYVRWSTGELGFLNSDGLCVNTHGRLAVTRPGPRDRGNDLIGSPEISKDFKPGHYTAKYKLHGGFSFVKA